jgi:hypothetical protein
MIYRLRRAGFDAFHTFRTNAAVEAAIRFALSFFFGQGQFNFLETLSLRR